MIEESFEPPLAEQLPAELAPPAALRERTLAAVTRVRRTRRWKRFGTLAIAASLVAVLGTSLTPRQKRASDVPGGASILLAAKRAQPAFASLDQAERELRAALTASPGDADLGAALAAVQDRRERLQRLVREAAS
ncbi:MAG: hypothetical protein V9E87_03425 [Gemmatimonadales bacterium]